MSSLSRLSFMAGECAAHAERQIGERVLVQVEDRELVVTVELRDDVQLDEAERDELARRIVEFITALDDVHCSLGGSGLRMVDR